MDETLEKKILDLLDQHRIMTVATNRPDGWPQATTVGYVNDGMTIYFLCSPQSQKAANLARDNRISLTIDHNVSEPMAITGLSMAAQAYPVSNPAEVAIHSSDDLDPLGCVPLCHECARDRRVEEIDGQRIVHDASRTRWG